MLIINKKTPIFLFAYPPKPLISLGFPSMTVCLFITQISFFLCQCHIINIIKTHNRYSIKCLETRTNSGFQRFVNPSPTSTFIPFDFQINFIEPRKPFTGAGFGASYQNLRNALLARVSEVRFKTVFYFDEIKRQIVAERERIFRRDEMLTSVLFGDQKSGVSQEFFSAKEVCRSSGDPLTENRPFRICDQVFEVENKKQTAGQTNEKLERWILV